MQCRAVSSCAGQGDGDEGAVEAGVGRVNAEAALRKRVGQIVLVKEGSSIGDSIQDFNLVKLSVSFFS